MSLPVSITPRKIAANPELLTADAVLDAMQRAQTERTNMEKSR
jgi:hypothetical protein